MKLLVIASVVLPIVVAQLGHARRGRSSLPPEMQRGRDAIVKAQCNRCHEVTDAMGARRGLRPLKKRDHCVRCHEWILGTRGDDAAIKKYKKRYGNNYSNSNFRWFHF